MKRSENETRVCVPGSCVNEIEEAMKRDGLLDDTVAVYAGRDPRVRSSFPVEERKKTFRRIYEGCIDNIVLEQGAFDDAEMENTFIGIMSVVVISHYDEAELTDYFIKAINDARG